MVPNGAAYDNYPSFANNGTKTPPGGSTESAKYALGMVPADTFPAEWANYLFHGATAGITRLNSDTGSIKKEINSVLEAKNITPDATNNAQLLEALNKFKAEAALAAHPVGSLYWTSVNENPAVTFGGGTWVQIKDRFVWAKGDTDTVNATGGSKTVTLTEQQIPSHTHKVTASGSIANTTATGSIANTTATGSISVTTTPTFTGTPVSSNGMNSNVSHSHQVTRYNTGSGSYPNVGYFSGGDGAGNRGADSRYGGFTNSANIDHTHSVTAKGTISGGAYSFSGTAHSHTFTGTAHSHTFTGTEVTSVATGGGESHNNMPPYVVKYCWERTA